MTQLLFIVFVLVFGMLTERAFALHEADPIRISNR